MGLIFRHTDQAALISELQLEMLDQQHQLREALAGLAPTTDSICGILVRLDEEQVRIDVTRAGIELLVECWNDLKPKAHFLNPSRRYSVLTRAIEDISRSEQPALDQEAADVLVTYMIIKQNCHCLDIGAMHAYRYNMFASEEGYALVCCISA